MKLEHEIQIDAPAETVWQVTVDVANWPSWTPTVEHIERLGEGPFGIGSEAIIKQPGLPAARWRVTELIPQSEFTWETRVRGIHMVATHQLTPCDGGTTNLLRLEMKGLAATLLWPLVRGSVNRSLEKENAGLKARCEAIVGE